jgi:Outer membrane protein beta-barrel domain
MTAKFVVRFALIALVLGLSAASLAAQSVEIYPYAGAYWPNNSDELGKIKADGIYGVKAGTFLDQNVELEGSFGYINNFNNGSQPNPFGAFSFFGQPRSYGLLYDVNGVWNFGSRSLFGHRLSPFIVVGAGGLTAYVKNADSTDVLGGGFIFSPFTGALIPNPQRRIVMEDADTFLTFNYGGGVKAMNLWGPVGVRADIRGRTLPNYFGKTVSWPELTGGVVFSWGER